ncbi:hypothetical protein SAY86_005862 [Trapa natans]|uniref:Uncharacterized protein n=1 Tax=Trapa natans TaxID=22666 RepID=A0AAN7L3N4_TRANT|nr:hypothetical protein SAY86_005862 [Trapa natans]
MEAMDMELDEDRLVESLSEDKPLKRLGLKNTIQTNFGDDYVFEITPKFDWTMMGVSLSTNAVKLYSPETGQFCGECRGHTATINRISFSGPSGPHVLHSCSSDGTIRAWDTRTFKEVSCIRAGHSQEIFCFSFGGSSNVLLSAGCDSQILFWDWRNKMQMACLEESHVDDVTQVQFVPEQPNTLVSASVDGLICVFDTAGDIDDDDHMESVINVGTSIGKIGMFGRNYEKLWCLTHIETLSVWDWKNCANIGNFEDTRSLASNSWKNGQVDYFVDCHHEDDGLWVIGATNLGALGFFPVNYTAGPTIGPAEAVLEGGHTGIVRSVLPLSGLPGTSSARRRGMFGWTGGEDGRLCCWFSDLSSDAQRSWTSTSLVSRSPRTHQKKYMHQPY